MKRKVLPLVIVFSVLLSVCVGASTPLSGYKWPSTYIYWNDNSTGSLARYYALRWTDGVNKWNDYTNTVIMNLGDSTNNLITTNVYNSSVDWDGNTVVYVDSIAKKILQTISRINTYYTESPNYNYTSDAISGLATHELGHAIGLAESGTAASVMYPYTLKADGSLARSLTPSADDISAVNSLYVAIPGVSDFQARIQNKMDKSFKKHVVLESSWAVCYGNISDLEKSADLVVSGIVLSSLGSRYPVKGDYENYKTYSSFKITRVIKGDAALSNAVITVSQMGGSDDETQVISAYTTELKANQHLVLFLKKRENNTYSPINEDDGIFAGVNGYYTNLSSNLHFDASAIQ